MQISPASLFMNWELLDQIYVILQSFQLVI